MIHPVLKVFKFNFKRFVFVFDGKFVIPSGDLIRFGLVLDLVTFSQDFGRKKIASIVFKLHNQLFFNITSEFIDFESICEISHLQRRFIIFHNSNQFDYFKLHRNSVFYAGKDFFFKHVIDDDSFFWTF